MANPVRPKRSNTAAAVPSAGSLAEGEIAVNFADKKIYGKDSAGVVQDLSGSGGSTTNASLLTSGTLADARLSSNVALAANVSAGFQNNALCVDTVPRFAVNSTYQSGSNLLLLSFVTPQITVSVSSITMISGNAGSGITTGRLGLFTFNESTLTATCVAKCDNLTTLFSASGTLYKLNFSTAGGFPASYTVQAGTRYAVGIFIVATAQPTMAAGAANITASLQAPRLGGYVTGYSGTDFVTSNSVSSAGYLTAVPWARLS